MSSKKKDVIPIYVNGGEEVATIPIIIGSNIVTRVVHSPIVTVPVTIVVPSKIESGKKEEKQPSIATKVVEKITTTPAGGGKEEGYDPSELIVRINKVESELRKVIDELRSKGYTDEDEEIKELYALRGDLRAWREKIAKYAVENKKVPSDIAYKLELFLSAVMNRIEQAKKLPAKNSNPEYHIRRLTEVYNQLYEYYWKLKELGFPSSLDIMKKIVELRRKIREWITKLKKYKESGKSVSKEEVSVLNRLYDEAKEVASDADYLAKTKKLNISVAMNETVYDAIVKYYIDDILDYAYLAKAQLYSIASYLKKEHFNVLREAIDNAINVLLGIKNKIRRGDEELSKEDIDKVVLAKGTIDNIMSIFAAIISRHAGLDPKDIMNKEIYKRLMLGDKELFNKLYKEYKRILNSCLEKHNERYCWSHLDDLLRENGFPLPRGTIEALIDVFNNYDLLKKGKKIEPSLSATASWTLDDITDYMFWPMLLGAQGQSYFKKLADETSDPVLKALYLTLSQASLVGGAFATGMWASLVNILTAGAATPVFLGAGLTKLAKEINYYFSDPLAQQEWNSFIEAVKRGDRDAILALSGLIAASIAGYIGSKLPSEIRVNDFLTLDQWLTLKMGEAFTKLADKAKMMGYNKLADVFENLASKYQLKIVGVSNAELSSKKLDIKISTDDYGNLVIRILEKGKIKGQKIDLKINPQMIKRFAGLAKLRTDETTKAILKYIETVLKSSDDVQQISRQLQFLDDLYNLVKQSKIAPEDLKAILNALKNGAKVRVTGPIHIAGKESYGYIIKTQGWLEVIRNDPKAPVTRIVYEFNPKKGYILKPVQVHGDIIEKVKVATIKDLEKLLGVSSRKELFRVLNEALGHPENPLAVISTENNQIILDLYHQLTIVTPKGALQAVSGNNFFLKMGDKVVRVLGSEFKRTMFVDPKARYVMEEIVKMPLTDDIANSLRLDTLKTALELAVKMFRQGKSVDEVVNKLSDVTKIPVASESGRQLLLQLAGAAQQFAKAGIVPDTVIPLVLTTGASGTGAVLSIMVGTSASALSQLAKSLSSQQARDLILSIKEKTGLKEVTAETLANLLDIDKDTAEVILVKAGEATEQKEVVVTETLETTIVLPQQVKTTTLETTIEKTTTLTKDIQLQVITIEETIPETIVLPQETQHITLPPETIEETTTLTTEVELPVVEVVETTQETITVPPQPIEKTIVVTREEPVVTTVNDIVKTIYITIPKTITVEIQKYIEEWVPLEDYQPQPQPPTTPKTTPAPPTPLPPTPAPPTGTQTKGTTLIKRGKQYEQIKI